MLCFLPSRYIRCAGTDYTSKRHTEEVVSARWTIGRMSDALALGPNWYLLGNGKYLPRNEFTSFCNWVSAFNLPSFRSRNAYTCTWPLCLCHATLFILLSSADNVLSGQSVRSLVKKLKHNIRPCPPLCARNARIVPWLLCSFRLWISVAMLDVRNNSVFAYVFFSTYPAPARSPSFCCHLRNMGFGGI